MGFWDVFIDESLQKPWVIGPEEPTSPGPQEPVTDKVFIVSQGLSDDLYVMISKMILALKYKAEDVTILEVDGFNVDFIQEWQTSKKILFFGQSFPGTFGEFSHLFGNQILTTHDLESLKDNIELKKQTWEHLKRYASLK